MNHPHQREDPLDAPVEFTRRVENTNETEHRPYGKSILANRRGLRVTFTALSKGNVHRCFY